MTPVREIVGRENLQKTGITQNQLSKITGVSNTYINYLKNGKIVSPGREKIIALGAGLNYSLEEINNLLREYRFKEIYENDFEIILKIARERTITGFQPFYENINYGLLLYTLENIPGDKYLVNKKPSATLEPPEYLLYRDRLRSREKTNPINNELKKVLLLERKKLLKKLLEKYRVTYIVCRHCFEEYATRTAREEPEKSFVISHLRELLKFMENPNYCFYLIEQCPRLRFTLKFCRNADAAFEKNILIVYGYGEHAYPGKKTVKDERDRLLGIATDSTKLFEHFAIENEDYINNHVSDRFYDRNRLIEYIDKTIIKTASGS